MWPNPSTANMPTLPEPSPEALVHSRQVTAHIRDQIAAAGGWIDFARYMELALHAPGLGYYSAGTRKFGEAGDFITAPELTPLFGRALAGLAAPLLAETRGDILELGPGSGRLALDLLLELERLEQLPACYRLLETSADLRQRQRQLFEHHAPHLLARLEWVDGLPDRLDGLVLGNEVLDALPVHVVHWGDERWFQRGVGLAGDGFAWSERPLQAGQLLDAARAIDAEPGYVSEINLAAPALVAELAGCLERGALLFLDYGFPQAEYYHPQRCAGTLMCHYRHHAHDDPFWLPGLNDITTHVDFSALARAAEAAGLDLLAYDSQAGFLLRTPLLELLGALGPGGAEYYRQAAAVQKLLSPSEMGELFKAIVFGRGVEGLGLEMGRDRRGRL